MNIMGYSGVSGKFIGQNILGCDTFLSDCDRFKNKVIEMNLQLYHLIESKSFFSAGIFSR